MAERIKVMLITTDTTVHCDELCQIDELLRELPKVGIDLALLCPPGGNLTDLAESLGIPVYHALIEFGYPLTGTLSVRAAIKSFNPHVVNAHGSRGAFFARMADSRASRRCVYTVHGIHVGRVGTKQRKAISTSLERMLRGRTAQFVCVCESDVRRGAAIGMLDPARATIVHNAVRLSSLEPAADAPPPGAFRAALQIAPEVPLVLSVGRFDEAKDQATLLSAWEQVVARIPEAVLVLVGSGDFEGDLKRQAKKANLCDAVRFVPPSSTPAPAFADADVFALSSRWEGLPYVVLEAMGHSLPVVVTAVDGVPEAVDDGVTGRLVHAEDPDALAQAIIEVLSDPERAREMGVAGRARVEREFTVEAFARACADVYRGVAGKA